MAKSLGLEVTGVLGVLLRAKVDGDIQSLRAEIDKLIQLGGFWLAEEFVQRLLEAVGETT